LIHLQHLENLKYLLGATYDNDAKFKRALDECRESLRILRVVYGNKHPEVAATLHTMGNMCEHQAQDERALVEKGESLRILLAAHGNEHPNVAATLHNKSGVYDIKASTSAPWVCFSSRFALS
jgi:hypothetical protein